MSDECQRCGRSDGLHDVRGHPEEFSEGTGKSLAGGGQEPAPDGMGATVRGSPAVRPANPGPSPSDGPCRYCGRTKAQCADEREDSCCERCSIGGWIALHERIPAILGSGEKPPTGEDAKPLSGAEQDATHLCGGKRFVPMAHHQDAHRKIKELGARLMETSALLGDALERQVDPCDHADVGKPGCLTCDTVRLDRVSK